MCILYIIYYIIYNTLTCFLTSIITVFVKDNPCIINQYSLFIRVDINQQSRLACVCFGEFMFPNAINYPFPNKNY